MPDSQNLEKLSLHARHEARSEVLRAIAAPGGAAWTSQG
jgi:hypothetical protein